jgi:hypothetical protein
VAKQYFIRRSQKVAGPFSRKRLRSMAQSDQLKKTDTFSSSKNGPWRDFATVFPDVDAEKQAPQPDDGFPDWDLADEDLVSSSLESVDAQSGGDDYRPHLQAKPKQRRRRTASPSRTKKSDSGWLGFVYLPGMLWEAIPGFVKALAIVVVVTIFAVVRPLINLNTQWQNDNGGRFGQHSIDTVSALHYKNKKEPVLHKIHIARRELRRALVRVDLLIDEFADEELVDEQEAISARRALDQIARERLLITPFSAEDFFSPVGELLALGTSFSVVTGLEEHMKRARRESKEAVGVGDRLLGRTTKVATDRRVADVPKSGTTRQRPAKVAQDPAKPPGSSSRGGIEPEAPVAPGAREALARACRIVEASTVFRDVSQWRDAADTATPDEGDKQLTILTSLQEELGDEPELTKECLQFIDLLRKFTTLDGQLHEARQSFAALNPMSANYVRLLELAARCQQVGVARLAAKGKIFAEIIDAAQDDKAAIQRLTALPSREFYRATHVSPLKTVTTDAGLRKLSDFHGNVRNQAAAIQLREQKSVDQKKLIVAANRETSKSNPLLVDSPAGTTSVASNIVARVGTTIVLAWTPHHDTYWQTPPRLDPAVIETLRSFGLRFGPRTESSLLLRVPGSVLSQLAGWLKQQRGVLGDKDNLHPPPTLPLFITSLENCERFLATGNWKHGATIVLTGELGHETVDGVKTPILNSKAIVTALPPNKKSLVHNRQHWGLSALAIRDDESFPTTLHWPKGSTRFVKTVPGGFSPFHETVTGLDGRSQYLRMLCQADSAQIESVNKAITTHLRSLVSDGRKTFSVTMTGALEQQLQSLVGAKQARIDARIIAGAGLRAVQGVDRFSTGTGDVFSDGALYRFNIAFLKNAISAKGHGYFFDTLLERSPVVLFTRDGISFLTIKESMEVLDRVLLSAGFETRSSAFADVSTAEIENLLPDLTLPPALPLGPPFPEIVPPPPGGDALAAWQQFVKQASGEYAVALKLHRSKCEDGGYNGNQHWADFSRTREAWRNTVRKKTASHASRLRTIRDHFSTRQQRVDEWKMFAATAMTRIKARAGRPSRTTSDDAGVPDDVVLVPSIPLTMNRSTSTSTAAADQALLKLFSAFDKDGNREIIPAEAFEDSPLFVMARFFDLDGKPNSVSGREWLLIAKATFQQVGGRTRGLEACQFLLAGPDAFRMNSPPVNGTSGR